MRPNRRDFLKVVGAAGAAAAFHEAQDVIWPSNLEGDAGWMPGLEERHMSTCLVCPGRCGIQGRVIDGRLVGIGGNSFHPMSRGGVCPRGVAGVQTLYHPERLSSPMVRVGSRGSGEWAPITLDGAIDIVSNRLQALRATDRPNALALLAGHCEGSMKDVLAQFLRAFGSPNYVSDEYSDPSDSVMNLMHGIPRRPGYDIDRAELVLSFGAPLFESWWSPLQAFVAFGGDSMDGRRRRFIQVDTRFSRTAARSQEWVGVRPGTHAVLALGIAYVMIRDEVFDAAFVESHVSGFEDFTDARGRSVEGYRSRVMRNFRTEEVSAVTGVPVERITSLARAFAQGQPSMAVCGTDVLLAPNGFLAGHAVHSLNVLANSVNRAGGVLFGSDPPVAPLVPPTLDDIALAGLRNEHVCGADPSFGMGDRALRFASAVTVNDQSSIDSLMLYYSNPLASSTHPEMWRRALERVPFIVSFSPFVDETSQYADVLIPDLLPYERWQDAPTPPSYPYSVWGLASPMVEPHGGGMHTGDVVLAIARRLGGAVEESLPYENFQAVLKARAQGLFELRRGMTLGDEFARQHHQQMEERGWWLPEHANFASFWDGLVQRGGWTDLMYDETDPGRLARTEDGRVHLMSSILLSALETEGNGREAYVTIGDENVSVTEQYPLRLLPYRVSTLASGTMSLQRWLAEQPSIFPDVHWVPWVELSPETARELGLNDGADVWVVSSRNRYRARLKIMSGTAPETVCAPYGLRHPDGEAANPFPLLDDTVDPLTGFGSLCSTFVRLDRA